MEPTPTAREPLTVVLDGADDRAELLGGKGAALARLVRWGLPVPSTGVVTAAAFRALVADPAVAGLIDEIERGRQVPAAEVDAAFAAAPVPVEVATAAAALARTVGAGARLAIRSSATVEDLDASSFAGQYRSLLGIDPDREDDVVDAVVAVFASLYHPAPCAYRRAFGIATRHAAMAAVVMRMVEADRAGVVFTVEPGSDGSRARVEEVAGLGDALVSGRATPEARSVRRDDLPSELPPHLRRATELAFEVERRAGRPQDVEWAWDGHDVWLVQARPITALGGDDGDGFDDPLDELVGLDLTTAGIGEMLPGVLPPLVWEIDRHLVEEAFRRLLASLGVLPADLVGPRGLVRRTRGRAALDFRRLQDMAGALPGEVGGELEQQYFGSRRAGRPLPATGRRTVGRVGSALHDLRVVRARNRSVLDAEIVVATAERFAAAERFTAAEAGEGVAGSDADGREIDEREIDVTLRRQAALIDLAARGMAAELGVAADAAALHRRLVDVLHPVLGPNDAARLADASTRLVGPAPMIHPVASAAVVAGPTWLELGLAPPITAPDAATAALDPFGDAFRAHGLDTSTWRARLRLHTVRRLAAETAEQLARRERTKAAVLLLGGLLRRTHLQLGHHLVRTGVLERAEDVDLLSPAELRRAVLGGPAPPPDLVRRRARRRRRDEQDGPLPLRFTGRPERVVTSLPAADRVEGWAASSGRFTGRARVVTGPADPFEPDEVLVAVATDPSWSPLFARAGAIVLERGGPLSHAAILARELGVPAVLNVPGATSRFGGRVVVVDGDVGVVARADEEARDDGAA